MKRVDCLLIAGLLLRDRADDCGRRVASKTVLKDSRKFGVSKVDELLRPRA